MSKTHFIIGIIAIAILVVVGIATAVIKIVEGLIIAAVVAFISPFMFKFMKRTQRHDDK